MGTASKKTVSSIRPTIDAEWTAITPDLAKTILKANGGNRPLRGGIVERYAKDMTNGRWTSTGDGIRIGTDDRLIDGQHRLSAIIKSGVTIEMFVFRNVPSVAQAAMDTGSRRTVADHLGMYLGEQNPVMLAAAAKIAIEMAATGSANRNGNVSTGEIVEFIEGNPDLRSATTLAQRVARQMDSPPATIAYCAWVLARLNSTATHEFFFGAATKENMHRYDPRMTLARRFADARRGKERLTRDAQISIVFRAWNYYIRGENIKFLRVRYTGNDVTIPKPVRPFGGVA